MVDVKRDLVADLATCTAATSGPWEISDTPDGTYVLDHSNYIVSTSDDYDDARFITEARTGWSDAIRRAMAAETEVERLRSALTDISERGWSDRFGGGYAYSGENHAECVRIARNALSGGERQ